MKVILLVAKARLCASETEQVNVGLSVGVGELGVELGKEEIAVLVSVVSSCRVCQSNQQPIQLRKPITSSTESLTKAQRFY